MHPRLQIERDDYRPDPEHAGMVLAESAGFDQTVRLPSDTVEALVPAPQGEANALGCEDILVSFARCRVTNSEVVFSVTRMATSDFDGETVTVEIDGSPIDATISGNRAVARVTGAGLGDHTVELVSPAGCFPARTVTCSEP